MRQAVFMDFVDVLPGNHSKTKSKGHEQFFCIHISVKSTHKKKKIISYTVKPAVKATCIKQSFVLKCHYLDPIKCKVVEIYPY